MDHFERELAVALRSAVSAPPTEIDADPIIRTRQHGRARTVGAPLATALLIAAIVGAVLAIVHTGGRPAHRAGSPPPVQQPSELVGFWALTDLQGLDGTGHTRPDAALRFHFGPDGSITQGGCTSARVTVGTGTLRFDQDFITTMPINCPRLSAQQAHFLFDRVLTGTAIWEIHDGALRVHHGAAGAVFQRVDGELTPAQRALAVRVAKRVAALSPPSGSSTPITATNGQGGWPSNLDRVWAIVTTHADAMQYVGAAGGDPSLVLVIRLVGNFSWITPGPPGHGPVLGNVATIVVDAHTGQTTDSGLEQQNPPRALPDATVLYQR